MTCIRHGLSKLVPKLILPALWGNTPEKKASVQRLKQAFQEAKPEKCQEFDLRIDKQNSINGMTLFLNPQEKQAFGDQTAKEQKWIIRFNGNNQWYEDWLNESLKFGKECQANVLVFNYRGVGESYGEVTKPEDLILDGEACVQYLLSKGVKEENILIYGQSLGGGVGTQVARIHDKVGMINDRSFGSLSKIVRAFTHSWLLAKLVTSLGWELDSAKAFAEMKNKKLIVFHKKDGVIPYHKASLYHVYKERIKAKNPDAFEKSLHKGKVKKRLKAEFKPRRVKLQEYITKGAELEAHNYAIYSDKGFREVQQFAREFFQGKSQDQIDGDAGEVADNGRQTDPF